MHFVLEPEVAGGLGETTVIDTSSHPPIVTKLEYKFDGWLGDDLLETFPCYVVTESLRIALEHTTLTGFAFDDVKVTTSDEFEEMREASGQMIMLPKFYWLKVHGMVGKDVFAIGTDNRLWISEEALDLLRHYNIANCDVEERPSPEPDN